MVSCCFGCVSKKVSGCWFLALLEAAAEIKFGDQNFDKIGFLVGFQKGHHHDYHHHQRQQKRYWTQCRNITNTVRLASFKCHAPLLHHDEEYAKQRTEKHTMNLNGSSHKDTLTTHNTWIKSSPKHLSPPLTAMAMHFYTFSGRARPSPSLLVGTSQCRVTTLLSRQDSNLKAFSRNPTDHLPGISLWASHINQASERNLPPVLISIITVAESSSSIR